MPPFHLLQIEARALMDVQQLMLVTMVVVLLVAGAATAVVTVIIRRSLRQRVESARLSAMGTATARILHQVKNPLQTVLLHAEMLEDEALVSDPVMRREVCQAIIGEATRMGEMLGELSSYASGIGHRLRLDPLPLEELVRDATRQIARELEKSGIALDVDAAESVPVAADAYYLRQALENMIRNSREALLEQPDSRDGRIEVSVRRRGGEAILEVRDNGPGIDQDKARTIFEPFVTTKSKGMGIGLSICREIVEGHGGRIELRGRPGEGVVVTITLPLARTPAPAHQPA